MWIRQKKRKKERFILIAGLLSSILLLIVIISPILTTTYVDNDEKDAITYMENMVEQISLYCQENAIDIVKDQDPSNTGLIGPEWTEMTSTIGHPEAKRTTINPEFAGLMVKLIKEAGVKRGETIAIGSSGSFPGLLLSSLAAAKAMNLKSKIILSLGSSSYGATRPELTILDIYQNIGSKYKKDCKVVGVSLGGEDDLGSDWDEGTVQYLKEKINNSGYRFINEPSITRSVDLRNKLYDFSYPSDTEVFINAGGAMANIGTSETILSLKPGVVKDFRIPEPEKQGVIHKALLADKAVIHLLNIKGLAIKYGLKWDPVIR